MATVQSFGGSLPKELIAILELLRSSGKLPDDIAHKAMILSGTEPGGCDDAEISQRLEDLEREAVICLLA